MTIRRASAAGARRIAPQVAVAAALLLVGAACATPVDRATPPSPEAAAARAPERTAGPASTAPLATPRTTPLGEPVRVVIPAIAVDARLIPVGLEDDGAMDVPDFGLAGWYSKGPMPGHPGPSVIAAHVDSWLGPDVFARLGQLEPGDLVHVDYDRGERVTFVVRRSEQHDKDALPAAAIWPTTNEPLLTLITCGGDYDRRARAHTANIIVFASLLGSS